MSKPWAACKNILVIRADNMGDLIMSTPALRALKQSFGCRLTVLTSAMGNAIVKHIDCIDDVMVYNAPWVKTIETTAAGEETKTLIEELAKRRFDAAVIFTVYSQNPLPAAMLALLAGIPQRLAYCRENPYGLLTQWIPDEEPYHVIQHQVERDIKLAAHVGAVATGKQLSLQYTAAAGASAKEKLAQAGVDITKPYVVFHPGVSEKKREYPVALWKDCIPLFLKKNDYTVLLTGSASELALANAIQKDTAAFSIAGLLGIDAFLALVDGASAVLSVNTGTIHIAAALQTPVAVLYAQTNPQHTPWQVKNAILPFSVDEHLRSKNEVIRFVNEKLYAEHIPYPSPREVVAALEKLLAK